MGFSRLMEGLITFNQSKYAHGREWLVSNVLLYALFQCLCKNVNADLMFEEAPVHNKYFWKKLDDLNCCNENSCNLSSLKKKGKLERKARRKRKKDARRKFKKSKIRRVGRKRSWIRRDKKDDLEKKATQRQDWRNVFFSNSPTDVILQPLQLYQGCSQHAQQSRSYRKSTPSPTVTAPIASLFSHPFSSCHSKCYSQLVKVHYTLSSWPEIYTLQCLCYAGEEGCNPFRLMTVHASWWKWWIYNIEYIYTELTWSSCGLKIRRICTTATHDSSALFFRRGRLT